MVQAFAVVTMFVYTDGFYALIVVHVYCAYDILVQMLDELNQTIEGEGPERLTNMRKHLVKIIESHQELFKVCN